MFQYGPTGTRAWPALPPQNYRPDSNAYPRFNDERRVDEMFSNQDISRRPYPDFGFTNYYLGEVYRPNDLTGEVVKSWMAKNVAIHSDLPRALPLYQFSVHRRETRTDEVLNVIRPIYPTVHLKQTDQCAHQRPVQQIDWLVGNVRLDT
ncbi:hypothetical protein SLS60_004023 [Paraconiothyrium brasiliense]|uniref:Uncharacterized protein n=1 Tax=Paraconiothyrium brasiliense TaxID=300254 RepID=A0ABR3RQB3_9PLEO